MTLEELALAFAAEADRLSPILDVEVIWPSMRLRRRTFIGEVAWPHELALSARAVVFKGSRVVVVRTSTGPPHVQPGGGIESGESFEQAARREVLEETGWTLGTLTPLGIHHFQPLGPPPAQFRRRWGDFVHPLFVAEALAYDRRARDMTQIELGSRLTPIGRALTELPADEASLLKAAFARRAETT
jgi:8-oxo-dGTP pyrophosphatase MutT (NUDIX family)